MQLILGDSLEKLKDLEDNSVDSIVTDPPYGLSFMGKKWDYDVPSVDIWKECLRVLKPGGYLLSFAGTRTQHRMAVNIEDAGFEIRDMIAWVYGSGFPKSLNIGKAVDKLQGNERTPYERPDFVARSNKTPQRESQVICGEKGKYTKGTSEWEGWGTALKPAHEPICMARKPLGEKTVAENVLKYGTGGINIDGSRIEYNSEDALKNDKGDTSKQHHKAVWQDTGHKERRDVFSPQGRFPANLIHDGSDEVVSLFPDSKSTAGVRRNQYNSVNAYSSDQAKDVYSGHNDSGSAARFFYCAKASKADRDEGLEGFESKFESMRPLSTTEDSDRDDMTTRLNSKSGRNHHPTVKPTKLMQYLVKLVTPKGGTVLDPFMGSGSTGKACKLEGFNFIGIEREEEYIEIAKARIEAAKPESKLF